jgi:hypothetical protein
MRDTTPSTQVLPGATIRWREGLPLLVAAVVVSAAAITSARFPANDFHAYHAAAGRLLRGEDLYGTAAGVYPYRYAPAVAFLFVPLAPFSFPTAKLLWLAVNAALVFGLTVASWRRDPARSWYALLAWLLLFKPLMNELHQGQADLAALGLAMLAFSLDDRGRPALGGAMLAGAAGLKVGPAIVALDWVARRRWRALAGFAAGGIALAAAPIPFYGVRGAVSLHASWLRSQQADAPLMIGPFGGNQSLWSIAARLALPGWALALGALLLLVLASTASPLERRRELLLLAAPFVSVYGWIQNFVVAYPVVLRLLLGTRATRVAAIVLAGGTAFVSTDFISSSAETWIETHKLIGAAFLAIFLVARAAAITSSRARPGLVEARD